MAKGKCLVAARRAEFMRDLLVIGPSVVSMEIRTRPRVICVILYFILANINSLTLARAV